MNNVRKIIKQASRDISKLNEDFEAMSTKNKRKSTSIKSSLDFKSESLKMRKRERAKHFESIRSKSR